jgi:tRNA(fMet)-specific endonuclease VapC
MSDLISTDRVRYLLDTNVCVDYLTGRYPSVRSRLQAESPDDVCTSSIVAAELRYGAARSRKAAENHAALDRLFAALNTADFDGDAARAYCRVRSALERSGGPIGPNDMLIAAHALALGLVLVTGNEGEMSRVEDLILVNWRVAEPVR